MKLEPVTKHDKKNTEASKNFDDEDMSANCDVAVSFQIYGQFAAIQKPDSGSIVYKTYTFIFINSNLLSYKT